MTVREWLDTPPPPEDLRTREGAFYIPYHIIVDYLNILTNGFWSTPDCRHHFYTLKNGKTLVSGDIVVAVTYDQNRDIHETEAKEGEFITRHLSGSATFALSKNSNPHPAASVKSLAIMNSVKPLGKRMGWGLNGFETESVYFPDEVNLVDTVFDVPNPIKEQIAATTTVEELAALKKTLPPSLMSAYMEQLKKLTKRI